MDRTSKATTEELPIALQLVLLLAAIAVLVGLMYYSVVYPWPGGPMGVSGFVQLWLKEIILVAFAAVGLLVFLLLWIVQLVRRVAASLGRSGSP
jgi:hypothetical protein